MADEWKDRRKKPTLDEVMEDLAAEFPPVQPWETGDEMNSVADKLRDAYEAMRPEIESLPRPTEPREDAK